MVTPEEIEALLQCPEGVDLEFKHSRVLPRVLARTIAAFANTRGGTVIVGVDDRQGSGPESLIGVEVDSFQRVVESVRRRLTPVPDFRAYCVAVQGKQLGVIEVEKNAGRNIAADGQIAVRAGTYTITVPAREILTESEFSDRSSFEGGSSREGRKVGRRRRLITIFALAVGVPGMIFLVRIIKCASPVSLLPAVLILVFGILFSGVAVEFVGWRPDPETVSPTRERVRRAEANLEQELRLRHADVSDAEAEDDARLTLSALWAVTHRRLDHYHTIALGQAAKSFRNAQVAMSVGFILLMGFAAIAFWASTTAGAVVAGALGAVAAALAGFVSRTFVKSQETAAGHLRAYFDQPLEFSRYLAAERLIVDARLDSGQRAEILGGLVQAMILGQLPAPEAQESSRSAQTN
ncbi:AlbA family DNA-binding domain-containing protein [Streptomyces cinereoruber]|uniref:AlbA family DNA-binding domain-containing protein n=1 Tax=Streptomyces cinereoruber TaxID=67260 RepID=UPI00364050AE